MRSRWVKVAVGAAVAALFGGRWLALQTADRLWAQSLGVATAHADVALLRLALTLGAFSVASAWYIGNLALLYRQIGAVQVPRQVGDLEIVEHVPRRYLLAGVLVIGFVLAAVSSHGAGDWWMARALTRAPDLAGDLPDPVLGRPESYYLFALPWERALQEFALRLTLVGGVLLTLLYAAVGAIRRQERRVVLMPFARWHLAALSGTVAVVLAWGFALEPAVLVAGLRNVPFDAVLRDVRIPASMVLGVLSLAAATASIVWLRVDRARIPVIAWLVLAGGVLVGRFMLPSVVSAGRVGDESDAVRAAESRALRRGFRLDVDTVALSLAVPDAGYPTHHATDLANAPIWDASVLTTVLKRMAHPGSDGCFLNVSLVAVPRAAGEPLPAYLAAREPAPAGGELEPGCATGEGSPARGVVAVVASRADPQGRPLFLPDLDDPGVATPTLAVLPLEVDATWFATGTTGHAITMGDAGPIGIPVRGWWRRVALAWALQYPGVLSSGRVPSGSLVVTERAVGGRLARYAPFAQFGAAWPTVLDGRLVWVAWGYVAAEGYPAGVPARWRNQRVRYLRAGFVGTVDAATGAIQVYLVRHADPLSRAWAALFPEVVRHPDGMSADLLRQVRYPDELFATQLRILRGEGRARVAEPYWWVGTAPGDSLVRLRLRAVDEIERDARVAAVLEGILDVDGPRLRVLRYPEPYVLAGPSELRRMFADAAPVGAVVAGDVVRLVPYEDGAVAQLSFYADSGTFVATVAGWRGVVGIGSTLLDALRHLTVQPDTTGVPAMPPLDAARAWFRKLDQARRDGDWQAFGQAWDGLREALGVPRGEGRVVPGQRRN